MNVELLDYLQSFITDERKQRFLDIIKNRSNHFTVVCEDVYQLHNTSAVMRTCDVFGVQQLHVVEQRWGKRIDTEIAMGAQKWVDIHRHQQIEDALAAVKAQGYRVVATTPHAPEHSLADFDITKPAAFFFGTERSGLSDVVMEQADELLTIPMYGFTESLNISVSAAILLQQVASRLRSSEIPWQLTQEEQFELLLQWTRSSIKDIERIEAVFHQGTRI